MIYQYYNNGMKVFLFKNGLICNHKIINFARINKQKNTRAMVTKLTLTLEQQIIKKAKEYAKNNGRSLSDIIENFLKVVIEENTKFETEITPIAKSLKGSFKMPSDFDYNKQLKKRLADKYLKQ